MGGAESGLSIGIGTGVTVARQRGMGSLGTAVAGRSGGGEPGTTAALGPADCVAVVDVAADGLCAVIGGLLEQATRLTTRPAAIVAARTVDPPRRPVDELRLRQHECPGLVVAAKAGMTLL
jgi:hypothetical protein